MAFNLLPFLITRQAAKNLDDSNKRNMLAFVAGMTHGQGFSSVVGPVALAQKEQAQQESSAAETQYRKKAAELEITKATNAELSTSTKEVLGVVVEEVNAITDKTSKATIAQNVVDRTKEHIVNLGWQLSFDDSTETMQIKPVVTAGLLDPQLSRTKVKDTTVAQLLKLVEAIDDRQVSRIASGITGRVETAVNPPTKPAQAKAVEKSGK